MENLVKHDAGVTLPETFAKTVTLTPKEIKIIKRYDPYQDPPDLEMAVEHGKAKRVYKQIKEDKYRNDMKKACSCCGLAIEGTQLPLNADLKEIYYLGSGYASYFAFIKYSAALLILLFITSGLFNILTNYYGEGCHSDVNNEPCDESFISRFALNNKRDDVKLLSVALVLNFAAVIAIIVFFHLIRYKFRKAEKNVDNETVTPSDYTLELKGIEPTMSDKEIASWLKKFGNPECPLNIVKINRTFNITKYIQQSKQRDVLMKRQAKFYENQDKSKAITSELGQIEAYFETFKRKKLDPTQVVYVIFQTAAEAEHVRDKFQKGFLREKFEHFFSLFISTYDRIAGKKITVKRAPEPTDILWENLHSSFGERFKRKIFVGFITATLVIIGLGIVVLINWLQKLIKGLDNAHWIRPLSLASSLLIFFWDLIVGFIIKKLASTEKNPTLTAYHTGLAGKLSVIQLINSGLTTLFAKLIIANDFSFSVSFKEKFHSINIYENGGLIENMYFVFIIFAFLQPLLTLFDPVYFYNRWRQSQVKHGKLQKKMNQKQAHQFFEGPELDMSEKYATLISNILVSSFYTPVMPFALLYSLMGLVLTYWIDKYVLFRRAALPKSLNNDLSSSMIEYLEWMAFMFAMGNFLFTYTLQGSSEQDTYNELPTALIWVTLGTSLFHIYFPMGWLNKQIFRIPMDKNETETYQQARFEFTTDYDIENPITRKQALKEFMFEVKGMIDMGSYDKKTMSTKGGAFTKLNLHEIAKLLDPNSQDDNQDFQFLEKYAHEARETNILERKTSIVNLRMDIIRLLSKFDNFKKRHSRSTIVAQFITNAKYSIGIKESRERLNSDNNYSRDSFKTPNHRDSILNSYDSEIRDDDFRSTVALRLNHTGYTGHELSRFADFKETSPTNQAGEDEILNFHVRQEFAQRSIVVQHKKFNYKNI